MPLFRRSWRCSVCGIELPNGVDLDCRACTDWALTRPRRRPRITASLHDYRESDGVVAELRRELEGIAL